MYVCVCVCVCMCVQSSPVGTGKRAKACWAPNGVLSVDAVLLSEHPNPKPGQLTRLRSLDRVAKTPEQCDTSFSQVLTSPPSLVAVHHSCRRTGLHGGGAQGGRRCEMRDRRCREGRAAVSVASGGASVAGGCQYCRLTNAHVRRNAFCAVRPPGHHAGPW